jgi:hypothetical protein
MKKGIFLSIAVLALVVSLFTSIMLFPLYKYGSIQTVIIQTILSLIGIIIPIVSIIKI